MQSNFKDQVRDQVRNDAKNIQGSWTELKAKIRQNWPRITEQALDEVNQNFEALTSKLQQAYGYTREQAIKEFEDFRGKHLSKIV
jgi:uncharacterized protein YjbJ (UPF0337 family)